MRLPVFAALSGYKTSPSARTVPSIDVTAANDLIEMGDDLRDAAQQGAEPPPLYRTVRDALDALGAP